MRELMVTARQIYFHGLKLCRAAPVSFALCCVALAALLLFAGIYVAGERQLAASRDQLAAMRRRPTVAAPAAPAPVAPMLPWFDSAHLVEQLDAVAEQAKLPIDEVGYAVEESAQQPYLRYRITLSVTAAYPAVRQFVDDVPASMSHVDLDSISCTRADIALPTPTCELAFSAFYRKGTHAE